MAGWRCVYLEDVDMELAFWAHIRAERRAVKRRRKAFIEAQLASPLMIGDDDERWEDLFLTS
jgi:hypothetical protein